jgi:hypothetical protein
MPSIV